MQANDSKLNYVFGGHQTFSLRQLWLYKAYHFFKDKSTDNNLLSPDESMIYLGVGSNMVDSVRFWAKSCHVIDQKDNVTDLANAVFGDLHDGYDSYLESTVSSWLFHWKLASTASKFTPLWFLFNVFNKSEFTKDEAEAALVSFLEREFSSGEIKKLPSENTIQRDIDVVIRCYCPKNYIIGNVSKTLKEGDSEDYADSLFRELQLITARNISSYSFNKRKHATLNPYLFAYCYLDFWYPLSLGQITADFNKIAYAPGSPGRVLKLDEISLESFLMDLGDVTGGMLRWVEQTGIRHVVSKLKDKSEIQTLQDDLLKKAYSYGTQG